MSSQLMLPEFQWGLLDILTGRALLVELSPGTTKLPLENSKGPGPAELHFIPDAFIILLQLPNIPPHSSILELQLILPEPSSESGGQH